MLFEVGEMKRKHEDSSSKKSKKRRLNSQLQGLDGHLAKGGTDYNAPSEMSEEEGNYSALRINIRQVNKAVVKLDYARIRKVSEFSSLFPLTWFLA